MSDLTKEPLVNVVGRVRAAVLGFGIPSWMRRDGDKALDELVRRLTEAEQERDRLRGRIVLAADAFHGHFEAQIVTGDLPDHGTGEREAYHELYAAADPDFASTVDPFERWREHADALEAHADE